MAGSIDLQLTLRNLMSSNARSLDTERELAVYKGDLLLSTFYWLCVCGLHWLRAFCQVT